MRPRLLMTYPFPLGRPTGGARMSREIARYLGRAGADVTLMPMSAAPMTCWKRPPVEREGLGFEFDEELASDNVKIVRIPQHPLHWIFDGRAAAQAVKREIAASKPDLVLSYYHEGAWLPKLLEPRGIKFGFISTWQSYERALAAPVRKVPRRLWSMMNRKLILEPHQRGKIFFATSTFTRGELVEHLGVPADRIVICPLGVAPRFFDLDIETRPQVRNLLFFGRVIASKGVADALEALGKLARRGIGDFRFRIVGQGNLDWARATAEEHGIADRVEVPGPADDAALKQELERADVAVLPSHFEAFGLCFAEAQAAGLPVVAYNAGSVPEIVQHDRTGWLAPLKDIDALAQCLETALRDAVATRAAGQAGRERAQQNFTWENTAATILSGVDR